MAGIDLFEDASISALIAAAIAGKMDKSANLNDVADKAASRANLGVAIGVNVQAWDAELDLWAGINPSTKQNQSANLDSWSGIAPATKQNQSANLDAWSAITTASKQNQSANLDEWSTVNPDTFGKTFVATAAVEDARLLMLQAPYISSIATLKSLNKDKDTVAILTEHGRFGVFVWKTGDYTARIAADTANAIYIKANGVAETVGAWVRQFWGAVDAPWFGAIGDGSVNTANMLTAEQAINTFILFEPHAVHFPSGTYDVGNAHHPFRNSSTTPLLNYNGVKIYGDGPTTIMKTTSPDGADVFQLQAVDNLEICNLAVTATLTDWSTSGSNGISLTSGWDRIYLHHIYGFNLPGTDAQFNSDGGKLISPQPSNTTNQCGSLMIHDIYAKQCLIGLTEDLDHVTHDDKRPVITVNNFISERCYRGLVAGGAAPSGVINDRYDCGNKINNFNTVNCQQDVFLARHYGGQIDVKTNDEDAMLAEDKRLNPVRGTATEPVVAASVDTATDRITVASNTDRWMNGAKVTGITTSGGLPGGLALATPYWVIRDYERIIATQYNVATNILTVINNTNRWETQQAVKFTVFAGSIWTGITAGTTYYIRRLSATTVSLHPTAGDAAADTNIIDITSAGSGIMTLEAINATTTMRLASSLANALAGTPIDLTSQGTGTHTFSLAWYWIASDTTVTGIHCAYQRYGRVAFHGNKGLCDYKVRIGGASAGSAGHNGRSEFADFFLDVGGVAAVADFEAVNNGGNIANGCNFKVTTRTVSRTLFPTLIYAHTRGNSIKFNDNLDDTITTWTYAAAITPNFYTEGLRFEMTFGAGNLTLNNPTGIADHVGKWGVIVLTQDGVGGRTLTRGTQWRAPGGALALSAGAGAVDTLPFYVRSATSIVIYPDAMNIS